MDIKKNKNGITLIALVVTIVVLLILAGISISMLAGQNGILDKAGEAKQSTEEASIKEQVELLATEYITNYYTGSATGASNIAEYVATNLNGKKVGVYDIGVSGKKVTISNQSGEKVLAGKIKDGGMVDWSKSWEYATENGKTIITDGTTKLNIGDYVDYDPADGATTTTYTSLATATGWDNDQVFNVSSLAKTSGAAWRVLGVDEQTGQILLVLAESFVGPTEGGQTNTTYGTTYYYLKGQNGYKNGVSELNKICELYGQGKYASGARSITVDDVNKITGFDPTGYEEGQIWEYGNEVTYSREGTSTLNYSTSNGKSGSNNKSTFNYFDESTKTWKEFGSTETGSVKLTSTYYWYSVSELSGLDDVSKEVILGNPQEGTNYYFTNTGAPMQYWLGSSYVGTYSNYADFGLRYVRGDDVYRNDLYYSDGYAYNPCCGVRPVVSLQSDINLEYNGTKEEWEFSK